jgi:hypothetical protein
MSGDTTFLYISLVFNLLFALISLGKSIRSFHSYCCSYTTSSDGEESPKTNRFQQILQKITPRPQKENSNPTSPRLDGGATSPPGTRGTREAPEGTRATREAQMDSQV